MSHYFISFFFNEQHAVEIKSPEMTSVKVDTANKNLPENSTMRCNGQLLYDKHNITMKNNTASRHFADQITSY